MIAGSWFDEVIASDCSLSRPASIKEFAVEGFN
jgi:hypothetical protein